MYLGRLLFCGGMDGSGRMPARTLNVGLHFVWSYSSICSGMLSGDGVVWGSNFELVEMGGFVRYALQVLCRWVR